MARRNRYREMESLMTKVLLCDVAVFVLFLVFSVKAWTVARVIAAIVSIMASLLSISWLAITGEVVRRRSLWLVTGFGAIFVCLLVSLLLKYPCPPV